MDAETSGRGNRLGIMELVSAECATALVRLRRVAMSSWEGWQLQHCWPSSRDGMAGESVKGDASSIADGHHFMCHNSVACWFVE